MNGNRTKNVLLIFLVAESFLASYGLLLGAQTTVVSILYLCSGLGFIFTILFLPQARIPRSANRIRDKILKIILTALLLFLAFITTRYWIFQIPLDPDFADMLPVIKTMNERFVHGNFKTVYDPIMEIWNGTRPIYLPAMWMPYSFAVLTGIDLRWVTAFLIFISFVIWLWILPILKNGYFGYVQLLTGAVLFWWIFSANDIHGLISMSEEGVVIFYYLLLCLAVISGNVWFIGITTACCMFSRYSMIGWLIPYLFFLIKNKRNRQVLIFISIGLGSLLIFFVFPFGFEPMKQMISLPGAYISFAKQVWLNTPEVFWLNLGMGKFFGVEHVAQLHYTLLVLTFVLPLLFMVFCLLQKRWKFQNINIAVLKLSILIFYQFIDVPYGYLFYTCSMVSLGIAACLLFENREGDLSQYKPDSSI